MDGVGDHHLLPRFPTAIIVALFAFIAVGAVVALHQEAPGGSTPAVANQPAAAAAWVAHEVSTGVAVGCDDRTCPALRAAGVRTTSVELATIVVITAPTLDAGTPSVLAAFGSGADQVEVRTVATPVADQSARATAGAELLRNPRLKISDQARAALSAGRVDARILSVLGGLAADHTVTVTGFGPATPGADIDAELRTVDIGQADTTSATVMSFLSAQTAVFRPADTALTGGVLRLHYRAPDPVGLFGPK